MLEVENIEIQEYFKDKRNWKTNSNVWMICSKDVQNISREGYHERELENLIDELQRKDNLEDDNG